MRDSSYTLDAWPFTVRNVKLSVAPWKGSRQGRCEIIVFHTAMFEVSVHDELHLQAKCSKHIQSTKAYLVYKKNLFPCVAQATRPCSNPFFFEFVPVSHQHILVKRNANTNSDSLAATD
jgi:hypothetical protein